MMRFWKGKKEMGIYLSNMEMPKNCMSCPFPAVGVDAYYCHCPTQDGKEYDFKYADTIPDTCPLVEIPTPHGRLIDADKIQDYNVETFGQRLLIIDTAPTIIEAEER